MNHSKGNGANKNTSQLIIPPYSASVPIRVMREVLNRAKQRAKQKPLPETQEEQLFTKIQQKGCLLHSALAGENTTTRGVQDAMDNFSYCAEKKLMSQKIPMQLPLI